MIDIFFAVSVLAAVIFFGALLSVGNERQRKAIDGIREQTALWAEQDLRLKRTRIGREVKVPDAKEWLAGVATQLLGSSIQLVSLKVWEKDGIKALIAPVSDGRKLVVTPIHPSQFVKAVKIKTKNKLAKMEMSILGNYQKRIPFHEMNLVTCGPFFDLEAKLAWAMTTGQLLEVDRLYLFEVPLQKK